jgi:small subunit ribosomal protein S1
LKIFLTSFADERNTNKFNMIEDKDLIEDQDDIFEGHDEETENDFDTHEEEFDSHDNDYESNEPAIELMLDEIPIEQIISLEDHKHDDFDWSLGPKNSSSYTEEERNKYLKDYENTLVSLSENEIVDGIVKTILDGDVILDLNYKSDGIIPLSDLKEKGELKPGDKVKVYIESLEDDKGRLKLSRKKAKLVEAWDALVDSHENGTILKGHIISKTKGGLIVDCQGLETFLPGSQIDIKPIIDYDQYVGKLMEFKVVKINEAIRNAVVSHKALIESDLAEQREVIIQGLEKGQVLEGVVKNITDFGAFMDLGGVDGLLYITDISWGRISHPSEVLELNQKIQVVVLDFDENKKRISLGLKQIQTHPWDTLDKEITEGSVVKGKIVNIEDYGAFLEIIPGVEGLIHVSEVTWSNQPVNATEYFELGQEFEAKVVTVDREDRKMSLSIKQLSDDPWSKIDEKYPTGKRVTGTVKNLTPYGVFVELEEGIGGMVHISDLSWTKRFSHPSEFTKVGEKIDIMILESNKETRKLSLGHKQVEENPWDTFEKVFPEGSYHEGVVTKKDDKGAIVQLPYGLEAFAPIRHLRKEDNTVPKVDETLTFKVIEFNRDDKRIIVSHRKFIDDVKKETEDNLEKEKVQEKKKVETIIKQQASNVERTTLGELDAFSEIMTQLEDNKKAEEKAATKKAKAEKEESKKEEVVLEKSEKAEAVVDELVKDEAKVEKKSSKKESKGTDDLKKIEGVGPKIAAILTENGIVTFADLAGAEVEKLREILLAAGSRYKMHDPATWPEQAKLAAEGDWDALEKLQSSLDGGKK